MAMTTTITTTTTTTIYELRIDIAAKTILVGKTTTNLEGGELVHVFDGSIEEALQLACTSSVPLLGYAQRVDVIDFQPIESAKQLAADRGGMPTFGCGAPEGEQDCYALWFVADTRTSTGTLVGGEPGPKPILPPTEANPKFVLRTKKSMPLSGPRPSPTMDDTRI